MLHLSRSLPALVGASVLLPSLVLLGGCGPDWSPPGPERSETRNVELDNSEEVRAELRMGAGELRVRGGAAKLMEARFVYNRLRLRPEVSYHSGGFRGHLLVEEPSGVHGGTNRYEWDLAFNDEKPLDLEVKCGAGESHLDLGELSLRRVNVQMGGGRTALGSARRAQERLRGFHSRRCWGGDGPIYPGNGVGVEAEARGGIGGVQTTGLQKRDGRYVNDALGHAKTTVRLDVRGGIGSIRLIAE